ncbi:unnamed protein product [Vicia faba]|uniref:Uncharacterized protein n=1 Tax=Vicia faba TaxID=3906 RepID=A0AAV0ZZW6_VICFA|nr:unnamed protein product [Vicia faba]
MALEKEHYVDVLEYYEIMELLNDAKYLKTMLNDGYGFPKLIKEFVITNDVTSHWLLNFSYIMFRQKDVLDIVSNSCAPVDETDLVFVGEMLEIFDLNMLFLLLQVCGEDDDMIILKGCGFQLVFVRSCVLLLCLHLLWFVVCCWSYVLWLF